MESKWISITKELPKPQVKVQLSFKPSGTRAAVCDDWVSTGWLTKGGIWSIKQNGNVPKGAKPSHWRDLN